MPETLASLLNVPGLGGYLSKKSYNDRREAHDLRQATGLMAIINAVEEQKQRQRQQQMDAAVRDAVAGSGGDVEAAMRSVLSAGDVGGAAKLAPVLRLQQETRQREETTRAMRDLNATYATAGQGPQELGEGQPISVAGDTPSAVPDDKGRRRAHLVKLTELYANNPVVMQRLQVEIDKLDKSAETKAAQPTTLARLLEERTALPEGHPNRAFYDNALRKESETARQIAPPVVVAPDDKAPRTINTAQGVLEWNPTTKKWVPVVVDTPAPPQPQATDAGNLDARDLRARLAQPGPTTTRAMPPSLAGGGAMSPQTLAFTAKQYLAGDRQAAQGYARNSTARIALQNAIVDEATRQGLTPPEVAAKLSEYAGITAGQRTIGQRSANIALAATEAEEMLGIVKDTSDKFARTNFVPWNMALKAYESGTGTPEIAAFGAAVNALVNVYARAINPTGVPTVSDKDHARAVLNTVQSPAQVDAVLGIIKRELAIAKKAPASVRDNLRKETVRSGGGGAPRAEDFFR